MTVIIDIIKTMRSKENLYQWCKDNNKALLSEWDKERNDLEGLDIKKLTPYSNKDVWWKCSKKHEWKNTVYRRVKFNSLCPICKGRRLAVGINDLKTTHPSLIKDWDFNKNIIQPNEVTANSHKKVFWKCNICKYSWETMIKNRAIDGDGCRICAAKQRGKQKHLSLLKKNGCLSDKRIIQDWDWEMNKLTPNDYTSSSNEKVYWKCNKCKYKWKASISSRTRGSKCPCCSNRIVIKGLNDLATTHPDIAKEWHPTKNGSLKPSDVTYGCGKKIYWQCNKGHDYRTTINHRTTGRGTNCPICNLGRQSSFPEQALYYYIKKEFADAINKYKADFLEKMELDIYIPSYKYGIEYDGAPWHNKNKLNSEKKKYYLCHKNGIKLIRVREEMSELGSDTSNWQVGGNKELYKPKYLNEVIIEVIQHLTLKSRLQIDVNVQRDRKEILEYLNENDGITFASEYPELAREWHPTKNGKLKPNMFKPHSDHCAWWLCPDCGKEYYTSIGHRSYGTGCPACQSIKSHINRRIPVEMIDLKTNKVVDTFSSISEASKKTNINSSNISMVCNGKTNRTKAGGYGWRYLNKTLSNKS